jgi:hypothetical protein
VDDVKWLETLVEASAREIAHLQEADDPSSSDLLDDLEAFHRDAVLRLDDARGSPHSDG